MTDELARLAEHALLGATAPGVLLRIRHLEDALLRIAALPETADVDEAVIIAQVALGQRT